MTHEPLRSLLADLLDNVDRMVEFETKAAYARGWADRGERDATIAEWFYSNNVIFFLPRLQEKIAAAIRAVPDPEPEL